MKKNYTCDRNTDLLYKEKVLMIINNERIIFEVFWEFRIFIVIVYQCSI